MIKLLRNIVIIVIIFGVTTALIDYYKLKKYEKPVFALSSYNEVSKKEYYRGLFYQASRIVTINNKEPISNSKSLTYYVLTYPINIKINKEKTNELNSFEIKEENNCSNEKEEYYTDDDKEVYTYCLDKIEIIKDNKKEELKIYFKKNSINDFLSSILYVGTKNSNIEVYTSDNKTNDNNLKVIRCTPSDKEKIIIGDKTMKYSDDLCTFEETIEENLDS